MIAGRERQNEMAIRRYLLGQAADEEQRLIEQNLLDDQEYFGRLLRHEEELIDEYACGSMKGADKECFEKHFMASPERRESVGFAQALHIYLTSQKRSHAGTWGLSSPWAARASIALTAAIVVLVAATGLLLRTTLQLRRQVGQHRAELSQAEQRDKALTEQVARLTALVQELSRVGPSAARDNSDMASLTLAPGLSRAADAASTLHLPANARTLRLILKIEGERHPSYRAEVQTVEGDVVWSNDGLIARRSGRQRIVEFILPTGLITRSDYLVVLSGTNTSGSFDKISTYHFSVIRK